MPILAITADVVAAERERCLAAGMDRCLTKPVVWPELFTALADAAAGGGPSATARAAGGPPAAAPLPAMADVPLLDRPLLEGMARELPEAAVRKLLARGLEGAGESCHRLKAASGDAGRMAQESHRLRGTAGTFGFARVSALAGMIEDRAGHGEDAAGLVAELEDAVGATRAAVGRSGLGA